MDPDGIQNDWKKKVFSSSDSASALTMMTRSSLVKPHRRAPADGLEPSAGAS